MQIGIMQPYIFPYIGYFQLIKSVDKFVFYDDVAFIKQGWINRNRILINGQGFLFTVPVKQISSFENIANTEILYLPDWRKKFLASIENAYKKAPFFKDVFLFINEIISKDHKDISSLARTSVISTLKYLQIPKDIVLTSEKYNNKHLKSEERIIDICKQENVAGYINAIGGTELYSKDTFNSKNISLQFLKPNIDPYIQFKNEFVPGLSIIDVLMFNDVNKVNQLLNNYQLI